MVAIAWKTLFSEKESKYFAGFRKTITGNKLKDILIGGGITLIGITYLTVTAFKNGCYTFEAEELQTMIDLGLIKDN